MKPDTGRESRVLPTLRLTPCYGGFRRRRDVWCGKTRMVWLPRWWKIFEDMFIRFDKMYERDKRTDRQTDKTPHDGIGRAYA